MPPTTNRAQPLHGLAAGLLAGLTASAVMSAFQAVATELFPATKGESEPATEKVSARVGEAANGTPLSESERHTGGETVHYAFGAGYGAVAEHWRPVTVGFGSAYGATAALVADDLAVPALGLAPSVTEQPAATHADALASHLVFGVVLEATRRLLRGR